MDLEPFRRINPCGYAGMEMTQMVTETDNEVSFSHVSDRLNYHLQHHLANDGESVDTHFPE